MHKNWIQGAIKKPGALTAQAKKEKAITPGGTIEKGWLKKKAKGGSSKVAQRARLAEILSSMRGGM
jgi:hypothetical protein